MDVHATGTTARPVRDARYTTPSLSMRRGPRGPSGVMAMCRVLVTSSACRKARVPPREDEPRTIAIPIAENEPATSAEQSGRFGDPLVGIGPNGGAVLADGEIEVGVRVRHGLGIAVNGFKVQIVLVLQA